MLYDLFTFLPFQNMSLHASMMEKLNTLNVSNCRREQIRPAFWRYSKVFPAASRSSWEDTRARAHVCFVEASGTLCLLLLSHDELCSYFLLLCSFQTALKISFRSTVPHSTSTHSYWVFFCISNTVWGMTATKYINESCDVGTDMYIWVFICIVHTNVHIYTFFLFLFI